MHTVVLYQTGWAPTQEIAVQIAAELGSRTIAFDRRPDPALYDLVVIGTAPWGQLDPGMLLWLASGVLRDKTVAIYHATLAGCWRELSQGVYDAAAAIGGVKLYPRELSVPWHPLSGYSEPDRNRVETWARQLASEFPPPAYPRGDSGRRLSRS